MPTYIHRSLPAIILVALIFGETIAQTGPDLGPWPMFHKDPAHTGFVPLDRPLSSQIAWTYPLSDTVEFASPVVSSFNTIYLGDVGKELWAFDTFGDTLWHYHAGGNLRYGTPAIAFDRTIYFGSADGNLHALYPTGTLKWISPLGGAVKTAPAIGEDGTIYVGSDDGNLYAVDPLDGGVIWHYPTGDTIRSSPAIGPDSTIYFGSSDGFIRAVDPDGELVWEGATGGPVKTSPCVFRDRVVVGSSDGFVYCIDANQGEVTWATPTDHNLRSSPAVGITGKVYIGAGNNICCYHDDDGDPCFEYPTGGRVYSSPAVTTGEDSLDIVVCGSDDGFLYAIKNGALLWRRWFGVPIRSSPAFGPGGYIYIGTLNGRIYALSDLAPSEVADGLDRGKLRLAIGPTPALPSQSIEIRLLGTMIAGGESISQDPGMLRIHDLNGRNICTLTLQPGGSVVWDGRDGSGRSVQSGVYWTSWTNGMHSASGRLVMLR
jgi:outer membrane protein assembly factor BamB